MVTVTGLGSLEILRVDLTRVTSFGGTAEITVYNNGLTLVPTIDGYAWDLVVIKSRHISGYHYFSGFPVRIRHFWDKTIIYLDSIEKALNRVITDVTNNILWEKPIEYISEEQSNDICYIYNYSGGLPGLSSNHGATFQKADLRSLSMNWTLLTNTGDQIPDDTGGSVLYTTYNNPEVDPHFYYTRNIKFEVTEVNRLMRFDFVFYANSNNLDSILESLSFLFDFQTAANEINRFGGSHWDTPPALQIWNFNSSAWEIIETS